MASLPAPIVMDIFVPVSPSGTGKMLRSSTYFRFFNMLFAPEMTASRSCFTSNHSIHILSENFRGGKKPAFAGIFLRFSIT
jgi:hypothetical protein